MSGDATVSPDLDPTSDEPARSVSRRRDSFLAFARPRGRDLQQRAMPLWEWSKTRIAAETWSFCRTLGERTPTIATFEDQGGVPRTGFNFASQDYLGLTFDERIRRACATTALATGPHSAGSEVNGGNLGVARELERELLRFLGVESVALFPTGWSAGYAAIRGLLRADDHAVVDELAHNCLQEGILASGAARHAFGHNDEDSLERTLSVIRATDSANAILVITEGLFSMDSDGPDLQRVVELTRRYGAYLLVDVAHDLGVLGPRGTGRLGEAGVLADADFLVGSFSKSFATTGGFVTSRYRECLLQIQAFGQANTFSNSLGPVNATAALEAMKILRSREGDALRDRTMLASHRLRDALSNEGFTVLGQPSALVPVLAGDEWFGRMLCRELGRSGILANFIEFPAVAIGRSRLRLQVSPAHDALDMNAIAGTVARCRDAVTR